jgi:hypothetical protein
MEQKICCVIVPISRDSGRWRVMYREAVRQQSAEACFAHCSDSSQGQPGVQLKRVPLCYEDKDGNVPILELMVFLVRKSGAG